MAALWVWVSVGDDRVCPDCRLRHGQKRAIEVWELVGLPGDGGTICGDQCRCLCIDENLLEGITIDRHIQTLSRAMQMRLIDAGLGDTSLLSSDRVELRERLMERIEPLAETAAELGILTDKSIMELIEIYETLRRQNATV